MCMEIWSYSLLVSKYYRANRPVLEWANSMSTGGSVRGGFLFPFHWNFPLLLSCFPGEAEWLKDWQVFQGNLASVILPTPSCPPVDRVETCWRRHWAAFPHRLSGWEQLLHLKVSVSTVLQLLILLYWVQSWFRMKGEKVSSHLIVSSTASVIFLKAIPRQVRRNCFC